MWQFLRQAYDVELVEYRGLLHDLIWISGFMGAFLVFSSILQYTFSLPPEISFSNDFNTIMVILVIKMLILLFGLISGVIHQLASEMHDIADLIRSISK
jgi:fluoride ion exporter CrcB/FEX